MARDPVGFKYQTRVVAFIDILGLRQHLADASAGKDIARTLSHALLRIVEDGQGKRRRKELSYRHITTGVKIEFERPPLFHNFLVDGYSLISDSIVVSIPDQISLTGDRRLSLIHTATILLHTVFYIQRQLIQLGILTRGAISTGHLFHSKHHVIGDGLVKAYNLERSCAVYPRVVLDPELVEKLTEETHQLTRDRRLDIGHLFRQDSDGMYFCDYLGVDLENVEDDWESRLWNIEQFVTGEILKKPDVKIFQKLFWLQTYVAQSHNTFVTHPYGGQPHDRDGALQKLFPREMTPEETKKTEQEFFNLKQARARKRKLKRLQLTDIEVRVRLARSRSFTDKSNADPTICEAAASLALTEVQLRRIEARVLRKLLHPVKSEYADDYL